MSNDIKRIAFVVLVMLAMVIMGPTVAVGFMYGIWWPLGIAGLATLTAAAVLGGMAGLFALATKIFPDD